jgi:hypothetical protein
LRVRFINGYLSGIIESRILSLRDNSNMMSSDDREIIINDIIKAMNESFDARFEQMEASMNQRFAEVNAKLDGNTVEMKERFAAMDE